MGLTAKRIENLKPGKKRYAVGDGRGLFIDITPGGARTWIFRYRLNGKQEKVTIGPSSTIALKDAREKETNWQSKLRMESRPRSRSENREFKVPRTQRRKSLGSFTTRSKSFRIVKVMKTFIAIWKRTYIQSWAKESSRTLTHLISRESSIARETEGIQRRLFIFVERSSGCTITRSRSSLWPLIRPQWLRRSTLARRCGAVVNYLRKKYASSCE